MKAQIKVRRINRIFQTYKGRMLAMTIRTMKNKSTKMIMKKMMKSLYLQSHLRITMKMNGR
jgi:hypothetical protein